jgi:dihydrolipoamide dehydrogenase
VSGTHVDVAVIGAGPGGYVAAVRAAQLGQSVAIVEQQYWGGVCLNVGCVPAKTLLRNGEIAHILRDQAETYGISGPVEIDYAAAYARSRAVAADRVRGIHYLMKKNGVAEHHGRAEFTGPASLDVVAEDGGRTALTFDRAIIATGSTARLLPGIEPSANVGTFESMILAESVPARAVIVGAGPIGIEFAYLLRCYGAEVTVLEFQDRVLPAEDADVSRELRRQLTRLGVNVVTSARVERAEDDGSVVRVDYVAGDERHTIECEKVLVAVGFAPRVDGFGLETTGVALTERGAIAVDDHMRTNVPGIYAIGDVTAKLALAHVAEAQGIVAAEHAAGHEPLPIADYRMMPRATFSQPQVASFGLTEEQARAEHGEIVVSTFPFAANAKAHALGDPAGFVKLVATAEHGELVGAHLLGHDVSELLPQLTLAQRFELTAQDLTANVHTHPTMSEAMQEAFHGLVGPMINL